MEGLDLTKFCKTKSQANDFLYRLSNIASRIFLTNFSLEHELTSQFGLQKKDTFLSLMRDKNINPMSGPEIKNFFAKIQEVVSGMPVLSIALSYEPKDETLMFLSEWFLQNLNKQVLFDLSCDKDLIAGAAINFQGKHFDFSLRPLFLKNIKDTYKNGATPPSGINNDAIRNVTH